MDNAGQSAGRRPWYWLVLVAFLALASAGAVFQNMRSRVDANDAAFAASQRLALQRVEQRIDSYFGDAEQLVRVGAQVAPNVSGNLPLAEQLVAELARARKTKDVYGLGVFYEPYTFEPHTQFVSIYDRAGVLNDSFDTRLPGGFVQVLFYGAGHTLADYYTKWVWYRDSKKAKGETVVDGPYVEEGVSYISTMRAFTRNGRFGGVFSVDILTTHFKALLASGLAKGDIAGVANRKGTWLLATARLPANAAATRIDASAPLHFTRAILHVSTDATQLRYANGQIETASYVLIFLIAAFAIVTSIVLQQRWQLEDETRALQSEQARLEHEVSVAKRVETELRRMAYTDALTGLPNRAAFMDRVRDLLESAPSGSHTIFLVDLDRFNIVNETVGHTAGDELLRAMASRLWSSLPQDTSVARLGGDEFVIVAPVSVDVANATAAKILALIGEPIVVAGQTFKMQSSAGIVAIEHPYSNAEELLRDADIAVYHAKAQGRACSAIFDTTMRARVARESELEADLRRAIERGDFTVHYQPLIRMATGEIASFEALTRWERPGKDPVSAAEFIPFAESRNLISQIDALMLRTVCSQTAAIRALFPGASIAANISAAEFASPELPSRLELLLKEYDVAPSSLKLEITETAMMTRVDIIGPTLQRLQELGIALVLDDFGTGYSSLAYLQSLPIVGLKIDRSFVENLDRDERALEVVRSIVALAVSFGLDTTAEGVETEAQRAVLAQLGVTYAQGYLFSKAVDVASLQALHARGSTRNEALPP